MHLVDLAGHHVSRIVEAVLPLGQLTSLRLCNTGRSGQGMSNAGKPLLAVVMLRHADLRI